MLRIFGWFTLSILVLATALGFRKHFRSFIDNLKFKYSYQVAQMRTKDNMSKRLTQQAYIKGLKEGYALAKAQYENRSAILYRRNTDLIGTCGECGHKVHIVDREIPNFCVTCGCKFATVQNSLYPLSEVKDHE